MRHHWFQVNKTSHHVLDTNKMTNCYKSNTRETRHEDFHVHMDENIRIELIIGTLVANLPIFFEFSNE